ncbi:hypothetical protein EV562_113211 [Streptomyces sp. BK208]|nr:hypothetical protein EV562_113211 [Streptomyces sp. BK208]
MPGYLLRPDASGTTRPTLVVTNRRDGTLPGLLSYGAAEALARGWNAFLSAGVPAGPQGRVGCVRHAPAGGRSAAGRDAGRLGLRGAAAAAALPEGRRGGTLGGGQPVPRQAARAPDGLRR